MQPRDFSPNAPGSLQHNPGGYWTYHPFALPPLFRWSDRLVAALSAADRALALFRFKVLSAPLAFRHPFLVQEAAASCRLAGYALDFESCRAAGAQFSHAPHLAPAPQAAARQLQEALEYILGRGVGRMPLLSEIRTVHSLCRSEPDDERWPAGHFRTGQTWIGTDEGGPQAAEFVPPPPEEMLSSLESLLAFIEQPAEMPELLRLAMAHYQFWVIHPFYFANGRTSRLLVPWLMHVRGLLPGACLPVSRFLLRERDAYHAHLYAVARENAWQDWLIFFLNGLRAEAESGVDYLDRLHEARQAVIGQVSGERTAERLLTIIDFSLGRGYITVNQANALLPGGNFKSASRLVDRLASLGILEEITGQVRHRVYRLDVHWGDIFS